MTPDHPHGPTPLPNLEQLAEAAERAFPHARVGIVRPLLAQPYLLISKGWFAAILLRPEGEQLVVRAGLPNNGFAVSLGGMALLFGVKTRQLLLQQVLTWAREDRGWAVQGSFST
ncbi:MAG: hypothetical protein GC205_12145 [Bacteroidetes bacterium]|nr:hypothetical protein [Bacteroidota bacterium]